MRALSLRQPWGFAVTHLGKNLENRVWGHLRKGFAGNTELPREPFAIHASNTKPAIYDIEGVLQAAGLTRAEFEAMPLHDYRGGIIGMARIDDVLRTTEPEQIVEGTAERPFPHYMLRPEDRERYLAKPGHDLVQLMRWWLGPYAFELADRMALLRPVPCKGALSFWTVPSDVEALVMREWDLVRAIAADPAESLAMIHRAGPHGPSIEVRVDPALPKGVAKIQSGPQQQTLLFSEPPPKKPGGLH